MDQKQELKNYILRVKDITNSCRTFLFVKIDHHKDLENKTLEIGGGQLLSAIGLFSCIEYLSKIYVILTAKETFNRDGKTINATDAFVRTINDAPEKLGFDEENLEEVWNNWRNKLSHMLVPKRGTSMGYGITPGSESYIGQYELVKKLTETKPMKKFLNNKEENRTLYYIDFLAPSVDNLTNWLLEQLDNNEERIPKVLEWIRNEVES